MFYNQTNGSMSGTGRWKRSDLVKTQKIVWCKPSVSDRPPGLVTSIIQTRRAGYPWFLGFMWRSNFHLEVRKWPVLRTGWPFRRHSYHWNGFQKVEAGSNICYNYEQKCWICFELTFLAELIGWISIRYRKNEQLSCSQVRLSSWLRSHNKDNYIFISNRALHFK